MSYADPEERKACHKRWRERNPEKLRTWSLRWIRANPEKARLHHKRYYDGHREERVAAAIAWAKANPGKKRAAVARYKELHPELVAVRQKQWRGANPDRVRENKRIAQQNRRARLKHAKGTVTKSEFQQIILLQGRKCAECRRTTTLTMDHIVPIARGGKHDKTNIQGLCLACNMAKRARDPLDFARSSGRLL